MITYILSGEYVAAGGRVRQGNVRVSGVRARERERAARVSGCTGGGVLSGVGGSGVGERESVGGQLTGDEWGLRRVGGGGTGGSV